LIARNNKYSRNISKIIANHSHFKNKGSFLDIYTPIHRLLALDADKYTEYYRDEAHLTRKGAIYLKKDILAFLCDNQAIE
jgi:hypothetical protein